MKALIIIMMSGVLVNNYVLQKFLGICPFLGVSKKFDQPSRERYQPEPVVQDLTGLAGADSD